MIQTKRISRGRLLSARRTLVQQTRIRQSFERQLFTQLLQFFIKEELPEMNIEREELD